MLTRNGLGLDQDRTGPTSRRSGENVRPGLSDYPRRQARNGKLPPLPGRRIASAVVASERGTAGRAIASVVTMSPASTDQRHAPAALTTASQPSPSAVTCRACSGRGPEQGAGAGGAVTPPKYPALTERVLIITFRPCRSLASTPNAACCPITGQSRSGRERVTCDVRTWQ